MKKQKQEGTLRGNQVEHRGAHEKKKPYAPPCITFKEPLECLAALCNPPQGKGSPPLCTVASS